MRTLYMRSGDHVALVGRYINSHAVGVAKKELESFICPNITAEYTFHTCAGFPYKDNINIRDLLRLLHEREINDR